MNLPASDYAQRLCIDHRRLTPDEYGRAFLVEALHPELSREAKVKFIITGAPPDHLREEFSVETNPQQAELFAQARTRRICRELGLENARLLPQHENIICELAELLANSNSSWPLRHAEGTALARARELVALLPQTVESAKWLNDTSDGPAYKARF
jgi:hypothetical protein